MQNAESPHNRMAYIFSLPHYTVLLLLMTNCGHITNRQCLLAMKTAHTIPRLSTASALHCRPNARIPWIPKQGIHVAAPWVTYQLPERRCCAQVNPNAQFNAQGRHHRMTYTSN